jgi:Fe-S cluster biosynthesis and repair protein YggX
MDIAARIAQFENMAQADPENEMAHFSLGNAYMTAGRHADAAQAFLRCTELAPSMSRAYQLAAEALLKAGQKDRAAEVALRGYTIASERGDLMPKNGLAEMLKALGRPVPEVAPARPAANRDVSLLGGGSAPAAPAGEGGFIDRRTGRPGTKMSRPPFKGRLGEWIAANISQETWDAWIRQGTKVINELRLDLSREQDEEVYDQHMREFLGIDDELYEEITKGG